VISRRDAGRTSGRRTFEEHVREATSLAVYGCGILASVHVGGLKALEDRGLDYSRLTTLAGVSAGSVVVALLSVGYRSDSLYSTVKSMPFHQLPYPELGALLRATGNLTITLCKKLTGGGMHETRAKMHEAFEGNGPGLNSGGVMEHLIGEALEKAPLSDVPSELRALHTQIRARGITMRDITMGEVLEIFGKRLVIIVTELDTGRERRLTPEADRDLPVRVAVRMSMGVPGLFEPFQYQGHVYVDGGMCNDFPMNALPADDHRLGLMVRPSNWMWAHLGGLRARAKRWLHETTGESGGGGGGGGPGGRSSARGGDTAHPPPRGDGEEDEDLRGWLAEWLQSQARTRDGSLPHSSIYPVRDCFELMETCMQTMMDANLALQIRRLGDESGLGIAGGGVGGSRAAAASGTEAARGAVPTESAAWADGSASAVAPSPESRGSIEDTQAADIEGEAEAEAEDDGEGEDESDAERRSLFNLAPQILTLCGGAFSPFDFALSKEQHRQLYLSGQLSVHLAASEASIGQQPPDQLMCDMEEEDRIRALRYLMSLGS
jgi:predicted acylesterase/phospholipase RssA